MLKFVSLALVLATVNCQQVISGLSGLSGYGGGIISSGGVQYALVPLGGQQVVQQQPAYLTRQVIQAPRQVVVQAPKPVVLQAPQPQIISRQIDEAPQPYSFGFQSTDEEGNTLSRSESADGSGTVTGSYSYLDAQGLTRVVEYVADAAGYRATVKTNEPGTANANPADVQINAEEVPAQVQQAIAAYSAQGPRPVAQAPRVRARLN